MEHDIVSSKSSQGGRKTLFVDDLFPGFLKHHDDDHVSDGPMVTRKSRFCVVWGTHVEELVYQVVYPSELIRLQNPSIPGFPVVRNHEGNPLMPLR